MAISGTKRAVNENETNDPITRDRLERAMKRAMKRAKREEIEEALKERMLEAAKREHDDIVARMQAAHAVIEDIKRGIKE